MRPARVPVLLAVSLLVSLLPPVLGVAAGMAGGPPWSAERDYLAFGAVACAPAGGNGGGFAQLGGACFDVPFWVRRVALAVADDALPRTAGGYAFSTGFGGFTPMVPFCGGAEAAVPAGGPAVVLQVVVLDPAQAALACGGPAAGLAGTVRARAA